MPMSPGGVLGPHTGACLQDPGPGGSMTWASRPGGARTSGSRGAARPMGSVHGAPGRGPGGRAALVRVQGQWAHG